MQKKDMPKEEKGGKRNIDVREKHQLVASLWALIRLELTTQAHALNANQDLNAFVCRTTLQLSEPQRPGLAEMFTCSPLPLVLPPITE